MEGIIIKKLDLKDSGMLIVGYNGNREATMNKQWQTNEINFLMNQVRIGGQVEVEIIQKPNPKDASRPYNNITKVNMNDNWQMGVGAVIEKVEATQPKQEGSLMSVKDASIVSQVCVKGAVELAKPKDFKDSDELGEFLCMAALECAGAYSVVFDKLNGQ